MTGSHTERYNYLLTTHSIYSQWLYSFKTFSLSVENMTVFFYAFLMLYGFLLVDAQDVETVLAEANLEGYPSALFFDTISAKTNEAGTLDKSRVSALLESKEMQEALTKSALEYSAQVLNKSGQARNLLSDPGLCEYSWVSWLPWMGCDAPEVKEAPSPLPLIMESSYSCYSSNP